MVTTPKKPVRKSPVAKPRAPRVKAEANTSVPAGGVVAPETKPVAAAPKAVRKPRQSKGAAAPVKTPRPAAPRRAPATRAKAPLAKVRDVVAAVPVPEITPRKAAIAAAGIGGVAAAIGTALFLWRASKADQPAYRVVEQEGNFEVREYPALVVASTEERGPRADALNRGFDTLAGYIFAKNRPGRKISMTAPVLSDGSDTTAWRTRFIMPHGEARSDLPKPPSGVVLENESPRRVAAVRFPGRATDDLLAEMEGALRSWLQLRALPSEAKAEYAFYNSPMMPGPLRRNEVLVTLSTM